MVAYGMGTVALWHRAGRRASMVARMCQFVRITRGDGRKPCAYEMIPTEPMHRWKVAWESARKAAKVSCHFYDLRHTFISGLAESQASDSTVIALAGHVSRAMMERYSHIRMEAKRRAVDDLGGADFEPVVAQNWAQFYLEQVRRG